MPTIIINEEGSWKIIDTDTSTMGKSVKRSDLMSAIIKTKSYPEEQKLLSAIYSAILDREKENARYIERFKISPENFKIFELFFSEAKRYNNITR